MQRVVHHYVLWYFHRAGEPLPRPSDASIEKEVRIAVTTAAHSAGFKNADYIWYVTAPPSPLLTRGRPSIFICNAC